MQYGPLHKRRELRHRRDPGSSMPEREVQYVAPNRAGSSTTALTTVDLAIRVSSSYVNRGTHGEGPSETCLRVSSVGLSIHPVGRRQRRNVRRAVTAHDKAGPKGGLGIFVKNKTTSGSPPGLLSSKPRGRPDLSNDLQFMFIPCGECIVGGRKLWRHEGLGAATIHARSTSGLQFCRIGSGILCPHVFSVHSPRNIQVSIQNSSGLLRLKMCRWLAQA